MIQTFSCRALARRASLLLRHDDMSGRPNLLFFDERSAADERALELLPAGQSLLPSVLVPELQLSGSTADLRFDADVADVPARALAAEMAASRLENCRPLFNEWLNVARNARLDGDLDTEKMSVPSVLSEPAPQRVPVARKVKGRTAQRRFSNQTRRWRPN